MPNNKLAVPLCLNCDKRLTPQFKLDSYPKKLYKIKTDIIGFGKDADNMFCSTSCGYKFAFKMIRGGTMLPDIKAIRNKHLTQIEDAIAACDERGYPDAAASFDEIKKQFIKKMGRK